MGEEFQEEVSETERKEIEISCQHFKVDIMLRYPHDFILFFVRENDYVKRDYGLVYKLLNFDKNGYRGRISPE